MTDKKALYIAALSLDPATVGDVAENRFSTFITRDNNGTPENVTTAEYQVWTQAEAEAEGYLAGGIPTSDAGYSVYRIF